jgi:hydrogenase-1 operon protein HyaF
MNIKGIPVSVVGPGTQPTSEDGRELAYIDMPHDMDTFSKPLVPDPDEVEHLAGARQAMRWLRQALRRYEPGAAPVLANLSALDEENRELVNQILGEGEVSITCDGEIVARAQESVLAGVWRSVFLDVQGSVMADVLEVADVPHIVRLAQGAGRPVDVAGAVDDTEVVNAKALLVELQAHCERFAETGEPHSINLSLLPLSEAELEFLDGQLGRGAVDILSRSYGKCQVISTQSPNVWWVRYYNSMGTLILNSLEVTAVPEVVRAAPEDLGDSAKRLEEILEPYWSDVA